MKKKFQIIAVSALALAMMVTAMPVYASENKSDRFGSLTDSQAYGCLKDSDILTWKYDDGEIIVIGNGPKYSELYPNVTDPEHLLNDLTLYIGHRESADNNQSTFNNQGQMRTLVRDEAEMMLLKEFVHSFDWINADEYTRAKNVFERIANGHSGNSYEIIDYDLYSSFPVLSKKRGVCENFSTEYQRLATYVGLECVTYQPSVSHQDCLVKVNGQWLAVNPTAGTPFYSNLSTVPVDYETEYNRADEEFKNSDTYKRIEEQLKLEEQYRNGELTYEELEQKIIELYS